MGQKLDRRGSNQHQQAKWVENDERLVILKIFQHIYIFSRKKRIKFHLKYIESQWKQIVHTPPHHIPIHDFSIMDSNLTRGSKNFHHFFLILLTQIEDCWWGRIVRGGISRRLASRSVEKMVLVTGPTAKVNWRSFSDGHLRFNFILPGWSEVDAPLQAPGVPSAMHYSWKQLVLYIIIRIIIGAINCDALGDNYV